MTAQIDAVFGDLDVKAVKIGMVGRSCRRSTPSLTGLARWSPAHVVLDPVMVATSGDRLLASDAVEALRRRLIPRASVDHAKPARGRSAARRTHGGERKRRSRGRASGCWRWAARAVLIKGGHGQGS